MMAISELQIDLKNDPVYSQSPVADQSGEIDLKGDEIVDLNQPIDGPVMKSYDPSIAEKAGDFISDMRQGITHGDSWSFIQNVWRNTLNPNEAVPEYDEDGNVSDTTFYEKGQVTKWYHGIEPRLAMNYIINDVSSVKASYARNNQYVHLLSNSTTGSPTDIWLPSSNNIKPQISDQVTLGYFRNFRKNMFEFSVEGYYKTLDNMIDYRTGAELNFNATVEGELVYGEGRAYGVELLLRKKKGDFTGWVGYTLSRSQRQFKEINNGEWFSTRQDRIHDISVVLL